jgi:hypothetical protein
MNDGDGNLDVCVICLYIRVYICLFLFLSTNCDGIYIFMTRTFPSNLPSNLPLDILLDSSTFYFYFLLSNHVDTCYVLALIFISLK